MLKWGTYYRYVAVEIMGVQVIELTLLLYFTLTVLLLIYYSVSYSQSVIPCIAESVFSYIGSVECPVQLSPLFVYPVRLSSLFG